MTKDSDIVIQVAKAMFEQVHGYHPDLNWDNAFDTHRELYLRYARIAEPIFHDYYTTGDYVHDNTKLIDTDWIRFE